MCHTDEYIKIKFIGPNAFQITYESLPFSCSELTTPKVSCSPQVWRK
jgi:hypothetical protein